MPQEPLTKVAEIRAQLERGAYTVDADKVADAIVARLRAGSSSKEG